MTTIRASVKQVMYIKLKGETIFQEGKGKITYTVYYIENESARSMYMTLYYVYLIFMSYIHVHVYK